MNTNLDSQFKAEYSADRVRLQRLGINEADYLSSRRVTEGLQKLNTVGGMVALESDVPIEQRDVTDAGFVLEYHADPTYRFRGISEEDYVRSRRIDAGLEQIRK